MAYSKYAYLAHLRGFKSKYVNQAYEIAAGCFLEINDSRALSRYLDAVNVFLEYGIIEKAIQCCVQYGYKCQQKLSDPQHPEKLYRKAEELRDQHKLSHSCVIQQFDETKYAADLYKVLNELINFKVTIRMGKRPWISHTSLCKNCIDAYEKLNKHHIDLCNKKSNEPERIFGDQRKRNQEDLIERIIYKIFQRNKEEIIDKIDGEIREIMDDEMESRLKEMIKEKMTEMMKYRLISISNLEQRLKMGVEGFLSLEHEIYVKVKKDIEKEIDEQKHNIIVEIRRKRLENEIRERIEELCDKIRKRIKISKSPQFERKKARTRKKNKR
ncbi:hypothetical protein RF11_16135 [Thelohanellus kitauei]|uniref:Uncharacterized protein n=1 Tax=Thelohanellus kitauei TaxID=669202 RepID=A0A0C2JMN5_THEKT|nr:hypothetical protein RF11_16135 [Thelohanellus kitauei]